MKLELVKKLRAETGIPLLKCQQALAESGDDLAKAREFLRKTGEAAAAKKAERSTKEGRIALKIAERKGVAVSVFCETDFVARGDEFVKLTEEIAELALAKGVAAAHTEAADLLKAKIQKIGENISLGEIQVLAGEALASYLHSNGKIGVLVALKQGSKEVGKEVAMQIAAMNPTYLQPTDVPAELIAKEKEIQKVLLQNSGKPAAIWDKILEGKIRKFCEGQSLLKQAFVKDPSKTVEKFLAEMETEIADFVRLKI